MSPPLVRTTDRAARYAAVEVRREEVMRFLDALSSLPGYESVRDELAPVLDLNADREMFELRIEIRQGG